MKLLDWHSMDKLNQVSVPVQTKELLSILECKLASNSPLKFISPVDGTDICVQVGNRTFPNWKPREQPLKPYQHWNKRYWLNHDEMPHFAETACIEQFHRFEWDARWVTWSSGKPAFRTAPIEGHTKPLVSLQKELFDAVFNSKKSLESDLIRRGFDPKKIGGGCWDVIGWQKDKIVFVECKQYSKNGSKQWKDALQLSQKIWIASALNVGLSTNDFLLLDWHLS